MKVEESRTVAESTAAFISHMVQMKAEWFQNKGYRQKALYPTWFR